jgi:hypothetical protein
MAELERLAGDQWTDFNAHDPGITVLDAVCYALIDLGYRIFHPIPDLLAEAGPDAPSGFSSPAEALTCRAVTPEDLRRVVLDVPGVKNAWIETVDAASPPLRYDRSATTLSIDSGQASPPNTDAVIPAGLWRVLVEKSDLEDVDGTMLRREVARRLHAHRPLCEDFEDIVVLEPMRVAVYASVEIGETENGEAVMLGILEQIDQLISPAVGFLTLDQALAAGMTIDECFEGPALTRGFVDRRTLPAAERRVALHTSDVIRAITAAPGVRAVRWIRLARAGDMTGEAWSLALDASGAARLDIAASRIELVKERLTVKVELGRVADAFAAATQAARLFPALPRSSRDLAPPTGRGRDVTAYLPLETDLPRLYGVGPGALPDTADAHRQAQANQLRGYLALFDQLLANEYAQLGQLASLFSAADGSPRTYFAQPVASLDPDRVPILAPDVDGRALDELVEPEGSAAAPAALQRRNRLLNHLLARFAEAITDDPQEASAAVPADPDTLPARLLDAKRQFLQDIARLGAARGTGMNYLDPAATPPALADRVRLRLGLPDGPAARFLVVEHILLRALPEDAVNALPLLEAASRGDPWSSQLSFVFPTALKPLATLIERVAREETPAHIAAYVLWLNDAPFAAFAAAYDDWLGALRRHRLADRLNADPDGAGLAPEAVP